jgi:hypothetical protein
MTYRCVHKDSQLGFSVYRGDQRDDLLDDDLLLVAALPGTGRGEIAMRLIDPEHILFVHYTDCFPDLVEDFVASWESPKYKTRLISIEHHDATTIECSE